MMTMNAHSFLFFNGYFYYYQEGKCSDDENCTTETGFTVTLTQLQNGEKSRSGSPQLLDDKANDSKKVQTCIVQATIVSVSLIHILKIFLNLSL